MLTAFSFALALALAPAQTPASPIIQGAAGDTQSTPAPHYLFSSFRGNGEDGLHLAHSTDGLNWKALREDASFLKPEVGGKLMRDPSVCQGPDGTFHMVWTTGWFDRGIGIAHSSDLIHWSKQVSVPVMDHEPEAQNCWAPEILYDSESESFVVYWSTTILGQFKETDGQGEDWKKGSANHRIYQTTTKDFETWTPTTLFYDDGFSVIDAVILEAESGYVMLIKDETLKPEPQKNLRVARGDSAMGPFGAASPPFTESWVEGATALQVGDWWYVYFDAYTRQRYEGSRTRDFKNWEPLTDALKLPEGTRHGTAFRVPEKVVTALRADH